MTLPWRPWLLVTVAALGLIFVPGALTAQCPMCRTALSSPEGQAMVPAFQWAILLLLAVPFALVGTVALLIYRASRSQSEPTEARGATH